MRRPAGMPRWWAVMTLALASTLAASPAQATVSDPGDKISEEVRLAAATDDKITFWVTFSAQANLSDLNPLQAKPARSAAVRERELAAADQAQAQVRRILDGADADYQSFWISNRILVTGSPKLLESLAQRPEVATIEPDRPIPLPALSVQADSLSEVNGVEWNIDRIGAPRVWAEMATRGDGIVVANIDTGAQFDHPALAASYRGRSSSGGLDHNYNWFDPARVCPTAAPCDNNGHGSHTMGTMVGDDGASNQIGVAPGAKWIAAKGCEATNCSQASLLASGQWIIAPTDLAGANPRPDLAPDVVNNSWGGPGFDPFFADIVTSWVAAGIFPAFSTGNSGPGCATATSPGQYTNSYATGAFDISNTIASFSSRGPGRDGEVKPNLAAPGVNIRSSVAGGLYAGSSGTSMASPHTAATVALMWSAAPALRGDVAATRAVLDATAVDTADTTCGGTAADNNVFGEGRLDAFAAVSAVPRGPVGALRGTVTSAGVPLSGALVRAQGPVERTFVTGADGTYTFPVLIAGDYTVTASKFGYIAATAGASVTGGATTVADLSLAQAATFTVSGTVTSDGATVAGASVKLLGTPLASVTDGAGRYQIAAPQGAYQISATPPHRCADPLTRAMDLSANMTLDLVLPQRVDGFGYACAPATGAYPVATNLVNLTGDDVATTLALPFPIPFYGTNYTSVTVSTNGAAAFATGSATQSNVPIPSTGVPNGAVYPFWDDLIVDAAAGIYTTVTGAFPHRGFVIEWRNVRHFSDATQRLSFAAEIGEDGRIVLRYKDVAGLGLEAGSSATIGLENAAGTVALQYSANQAVLTGTTALAFRTTRHGVIRGKVTDANDGLGILAASVTTGSGETATTAADGTFLVQARAGEVALEVARPRYATANTTVSLAPADVALVDTSLATPKVTTTPGNVLLIVPEGQSRVRELSVANDGGLETPISVTLAPDQPWLNASLNATNLAPGATATLAVGVDMTGLAAGTVYDGVLRISSASGRTDQLLIAVRVVVPAFQVAIDAGASSPHVDPLGDTWTRDARFTAGQGCGYLGNSSTISTRTPITGTDDPARFTNGRTNMYEYRCEGLADGTYTVELDFAEIGGLRPNKRVFDVLIEGVLVLPSLDISLEAGRNAALSKMYTVTVTDGVLSIRFVRHSGFGKPLVNALRVTHRPDLG